MGLVSLILGLSDGNANRQWFWMLASSMIFIVGVQLLVSWSVMRVLEQLNKREGQVDKDLLGNAVRVE
jgi:flagellar biogenesis protein FliO